jgi:ribonuclease HI
VTFTPPATLNPATLRPEAEENPIHQCEKILVEKTGTQPDLADLPWPRKVACFTNGSSFMVEGKHRAGAAVVNRKSVIWANSLPEGTSAQRAELIAIIQALRLTKEKVINIYTNSQYAFATAHVHEAIYRQHGLLTSAEKDIKHKQEILSLLEAVHLPYKVTIIHCPRHQKGARLIERRNQMANQVAKEAVQKQTSLVVKITPQQVEEIPEKKSSQKKRN